MDTMRYLSYAIDGLAVLFLLWVAIYLWFDLQVPQWWDRLLDRFFRWVSIRLDKVRQEMAEKDRSEQNLQEVRARNRPRSAPRGS